MSKIIFSEPEYDQITKLYYSSAKYNIAFNFPGLLIEIRKHFNFQVEVEYKNTIILLTSADKKLLNYAIDFVCNTV